MIERWHWSDWDEIVAIVRDVPLIHEDEIEAALKLINCGCCETEEMARFFLERISTLRKQIA